MNPPSGPDPRPIGPAAMPIAPGAPPIGMAPPIGPPPPAARRPPPPAGPGIPSAAVPAAGAPDSGPPAARAHRTGAHRTCAGPSAQLLEEIERDVALHTAPQFPAREPAPEARLARRLEPLLHVLDHVHRRRPPEPRQAAPAAADRGSRSSRWPRRPVSRPDEAFDSRSVSVSSPSSWESSSTPTLIFFDDWPARNFSLPLAAV